MVILGKRATAPCGHDGEVVIGTYVRCLIGCDDPISSKPVENDVLIVRQFIRGITLMPGDRLNAARIDGKKYMILATVETDIIAVDHVDQYKSGRMVVVDKRKRQYEMEPSQ